MAVIPYAKPRFKAVTRHRNAILLALVWVSALILGTVFAVHAGNNYFLLMRGAPDCSVSIAGLLATVLLPYLFAAFAVYISKPKLLYLVCFAKVFAFAMCGYGICVAYGSAGWLVRWLLQFSDICTVPVLCWFSIRHLQGRSCTFRTDCLIYGGMVMLVGYLDYSLISPFLVILTEK